MLETLFILFTIISFILLFIGIEYEGEHEYWNYVFVLMSSFIMFMLAWQTFNINIPYQSFNATSGNIETGFQTYVFDYQLMYFYYGMAIIIFLYFVVLILFMLTKSLAPNLHKRLFKKM